jgi:hypothetical protein
MEKEERKGGMNKMDKKKMRWLLNRITNSRYVNLHLNDVEKPVDRVKDIGGGAEKSVDPGKDIYEEITGGKYTNDYCIDVNIGSIDINIDSLTEDNKDKKEMGKKLADIINREMAKDRFPHWIRDSLSIEDTLEQFDKRLDRAALIIFHYFQEPKDWKEKNILNSLRIFMDKNNPLYVQILIISSGKTEHWDLAPYSVLDERFVEYIPWSELQ